MSQITLAVPRNPKSAATDPEAVPCPEHGKEYLVEGLVLLQNLASCEYGESVPAVKVFVCQACSADAGMHDHTFLHFPKASLNLLRSAGLVKPNKYTVN